MKIRWLCMVCSVTVLLDLLNAAAVPTQDTFVIAKSEDEKKETPDSDVTTEEPNAPIKLTDMQVNTEVSLRYAHTAIVTNVKNPASRSQEATFHVLLPETAFITGFVMTLSGKSYKAYVKEKEEAKKIYTEAVSQGLGAAHISAKARDSNQFTVTVNVEPRSVAVFNLTYEELLVLRNGVYNEVINLYPGAPVPRMKVTVHIKESQKISLLRVPEVRTGNEIDATENDAQNTKAVIQKSDDGKEATITFTPDLEEQSRLMQIYADKTRESASSSYHWYSSQRDDESKSGILGQFVVQYNVERPANGEILVNDGYFVHFFAPPSLTPLSKHVVFVLDTSGSMSGRKIEQLRDAMKAILNDLHPKDYFSIVEFNSNVKVHKLSEADEEPSRPHYEWNYEDVPTTLVPPALATAENIAKAQVIVSRFTAGGGTNIYKALGVAVDLINKKFEQTETNSTLVAKKTDDDINKDELQPIIIFLTDGDATMGETNPSRILGFISERNFGENKAAIYSLAFGYDADHNLLRKMSLKNEGFMRRIYEAADAALQLRHFYQQVSSPLLSHVNFVYPPEQIKAGSVTRHKFNAVFSGSEAVVAGVLAPDAVELTPQVHAFCADDDNHGRKRYEVKNKVAVSEKNEYLPLERLWAYLTIKQLLDEREAQDDIPQKDENSPEKRALAIALKYAFVTPLTSLVVVKPNATNAVDAESVDKPAYALPQNLGFGYTMSSQSRPAYLSSHFSSGQLITSAQADPLPLDWATDFAEEEELIDSRFEVDNDRISSAGNKRITDSYFSRPTSLSAFSPDSYFSRPTPLSAFLPAGHNYAWPSQITDQHVLDSALLMPSAPKAPLTTTIPPATTTEPLEKTYHLEGFSWALNLLNRNTNSLEFLANEKNVTLEITKDSVPPKESVDSKCGETAVEKSSVAEEKMCVYLTRCAAAKDIGVEEYRNTYCIVENKYAGVCCPRSKVDVQTS